MQLPYQQTFHGLFERWRGQTLSSSSSKVRVEYAVGDMNSLCICHHGCISLLRLGRVGEDRGRPTSHGQFIGQLGYLEPLLRQMFSGIHIVQYRGPHTVSPLLQVHPLVSLLELLVPDLPVLLFFWSLISHLSYSPLSKNPYIVFSLHTKQITRCTF